MFHPDMFRNMEAEAPAPIEVRPSEEEIDRQAEQRTKIRLIRDAILAIHDLTEDVLLDEPEDVEEDRIVAVGELDELDSLLKSAAMLATELAVDY